MSAHVITANGTKTGSIARGLVSPKIGFVQWAMADYTPTIYLAPHRATRGLHTPAHLERVDDGHGDAEVGQVGAPCARVEEGEAVVGGGGLDGVGLQVTQRLGLMRACREKKRE